jgi:hypothetical protein
METKQTELPRPIRSREEAHSECMRELEVRRRCYRRWIEDGKLSAVDARDRLERIEAAVQYLSDAAPQTSADPPELPVLIKMPPTTNAHTDALSQ